MHLKVIQTMQKIPRSIGIPPLSDSGFDQALAVQAAALASSGASSSVAGPSSGFNVPLGDDDGKINPLAGMGLTDEQYNMILQNMVNGESFMGIPGMGMGMAMMGMAMDSGKRGLEDPEDGRDGKKGRFEVIE